jgi:hypothetical protein
VRLAEGREFTGGTEQLADSCRKFGDPGADWTAAYRWDNDQQQRIRDRTNERMAGGAC